MLAFARRQDLTPVPIDVVALVGGMSELLTRTLGPAWPIDCRFPDHLPLIVADANQLEMAILNLAVNARDAMPEGGSIRVEASDRRLAPGGIEGLAEGHYLQLSVVDSGFGMDAETLSRATEPFFTTKGVGKGTGLGLSMIHGLASQLHGGFSLRSTPGAGTTATLWLPVAQAQIAAPSAPIEASAPGHRPLKILAVDDDFLILMNTAALLEDLGHQVLEANSGAEALALALEHPDIDLLITDQAMPKMTGVELAERMIEARPDLPMVLATGYGEVPASAKTAMVKLGKPFSQDQLAEAVAQALHLKRKSGLPV
jgi:CheY-like chemotaxis protein/anti-sigma regulatory factor (Ser/Thr protein kinase)